MNKKDCVDIMTAIYLTVIVIIFLCILILAGEDDFEKISVKPLPTFHSES
jgi:hypothetical protein